MLISGSLLCAFLLVLPFLPESLGLRAFAIPGDLLGLSAGPAHPFGHLEEVPTKKRPRVPNVCAVVLRLGPLKDLVPVTEMYDLKSGDIWRYSDNNLGDT